VGRLQVPCASPPAGGDYYRGIHQLTLLLNTGEKGLFPLQIEIRQRWGREKREMSSCLEN
jgi:hypothetical protein